MWYNIFKMLQPMGVDVLPQHFYSQIPNIKELKVETRWQKPLSFTDVKGSDIASQLTAFEAIFETDPLPLPLNDFYKQCVQTNGEDGGYGEIETVVLYHFILKHQPQRIVQVGCGVSTAIILAACKQLSNYTPTIVCVEPYPTVWLTKLHEAGTITLVKEKAQYADKKWFNALTANDLLFIDSTHTVKPGSEVNELILEIIPSLAPNVWVHFHDIFFPYGYKRDLLSGDLFFWNETVLLYAYLKRNPFFGIHFSTSMLHYAAPIAIRKFIPAYQQQQGNNGLIQLREGHFPSSIFLKTF